MHEDIRGVVVVAVDQVRSPRRERDHLAVTGNARDVAVVVPLAAVARNADADERSVDLYGACSPALSARTACLSNTRATRLSSPSDAQSSPVVRGAACPAVPRLTLDSA